VVNHRIDQTHDLDGSVTEQQEALSTATTTTSMLTYKKHPEFDI
jgi:hypothetical protein